MKTQIKKLFNKTLRDEANARTRAQTGERLHVSELIRACPRRTAFLISGEVVDYPDQSPVIPSEMAFTFAIGRAFQGILEHNIHTIVKGKWSCSACAFFYIGQRPKKGKCPKCNAPIEYQELELVHSVTDQTAIVGHIDLLVSDGTSSYPVECKSIKRDSFENLTAPEPSHKYQLLSYMWMLKKQGISKEAQQLRVKGTRGFIVYLCKEHTKMPIKVFELTPDKTVERNLDALCTGIRKYHRTGELPPRECSTPKGLIARKCVAKDVCWQKEGISG